MKTRPNRDFRYMSKALELAAQGPSLVAPNPKVGAVIVHRNKIVGRGFHRGPGHPHAEIEAIRDAESRGFRSFSRAEIFCTLEPCVHTNKRTPPCTPELIRQKFSRVIVAHQDPNPNVRGRGIKSLRAKKMKVKVGCLKEECSLLNQIFIKNQLTKRPYVTMKLALTFDGRMADDFGDSQWITSEKSRQLTHRLRAEADTLVVGARTLDHDNPQLNVRLNQKSESRRVFVLGKPKLNPSRWNCIKANGHSQVHVFKRQANLDRFLREAYSKFGACHLMIEGGPKVASQFLEQNKVDRLILVYGRGLLVDQGNYSLKTKAQTLKRLSKCISFKPHKAQLIDADLWVEGFLHVYRPH